MGKRKGGKLKVTFLERVSAFVEEREKCEEGAGGAVDGGGEKECCGSQKYEISTKHLLKVKYVVSNSSF